MADEVVMVPTDPAVLAWIPTLSAADVDRVCSVIPVEALEAGDPVGTVASLRVSCAVLGLDVPWLPDGLEEVSSAAGGRALRSAVSLAGRRWVQALAVVDGLVEVDVTGEGALVAIFRSERLAQQLLWAGEGPLAPVAELVGVRFFAGPSGR